MACTEYVPSSVSCQLILWKAGFWIFSRPQASGGWTVSFAGQEFQQQSSWDSQQHLYAFGKKKELLDLK